MGADYAEMIAKLQAGLAQQQQQGPSLFGLQAAPDPNNTAQLLQHLQNQQYVNEQGNQGGEYGFLANAGKKDFARAGQSLGALLGVGQAPKQDNSAIMQQRQAIQDGKAQLSQGLSQPNADPNQVQMQVLTRLAQQGVPGAADALEKANDNAQKLATSRASAFKDTAQGNAATDEISNRAAQNAMRQAEIDKGTSKDTWNTISETPQTVVQKNGLGEVRVQQKMPAAQAAAANVSPDAMQAMLDSYHTTGTIPGGLARSPAMAGAFWQAESDFQKQTGNTAASVLAQKASSTANKDALTKTQAQLSQTTSYADTMNKNIDNANELARKLNLTDQPTLNRALSAYAAGTSNPDFAKYHVFVDSVVNEYAKIKSGALGNAPVSDSARKEAQSIIVPLMSAGGIAAAFQAVKQEGQNRLDSLATQRDDLVTRLSAKPPINNTQQAPPIVAPQAAPPAAPAALTYDPKTGTFH